MVLQFHLGMCWKVPSKLVCIFGNNLMLILEELSHFTLYFLISISPTRFTDISIWFWFRRMKSTVLSCCVCASRQYANDMRQIHYSIAIRISSHQLRNCQRAKTSKKSFIFFSLRSRLYWNEETCATLSIWSWCEFHSYGVCKSS